MSGCCSTANSVGNGKILLPAEDHTLQQHKHQKGNLYCGNSW